MRILTGIAINVCLVSVSADAQGRLRPPEGMACDRNELTSYTGEAKRYTRTKNRVTVTIRTDEVTTERVTAPIGTMRLDGMAFQPADFPKIETRPGVLRCRVRLTAWVCKSGTVMLDWTSPSPPR